MTLDLRSKILGRFKGVLRIGVYRSNFGHGSPLIRFLWMNFIAIEPLFASRIIHVLNESSTVHDATGAQWIVMSNGVSAWAGIEQGGAVGARHWRR